MTNDPDEIVYHINVSLTMDDVLEILRDLGYEKDMIPPVMERFTQKLKEIDPSRHVDDDIVEIMENVLTCSSDDGSLDRYRLDNCQTPQEVMAYFDENWGDPMVFIEDGRATLTPSPEVCLRFIENTLSEQKEARRKRGKPLETGGILELTARRLRELGVTV